MWETFSPNASLEASDCIAFMKDLIRYGGGSGMMDKT
jgi:hypothetical protein